MNTANRGIPVCGNGSCAHGNRRNSILRKWRSGYKLAAIARECRVSTEEAARVIVGSGVKWLSLETRERT
jgi:hypothetical protein